MRRTTLCEILCVVVAAAAACGGGSKGKAVKPKHPVVKTTKPPPKPETEEDREQKRLAAAHELVPDGTNCLPTSLQPGESIPVLELGTVDGQPVICAMDTDESRLLGPVGCWTLNLESGGLTYRTPAPLPGRDFAVRLDGRCARGYCLPDDVPLPEPAIAHIAWSNGGDKVAVAITGGDPEIHIFAAADKAHQGVIKPKDTAHGDKAMTTDLAGVMFVGDVVGAVGTAGDAGAGVWMFKTDGTPLGAVERLGGKTKGAVSIAAGSVSVFGAGQLALNEDAMSTLTTIELSTGKRAKLVRKPPKTSCKAKDLEALLKGGGDKVPDKCKKDYAKEYAPLIGALVVQGKKNHLVLLRGDRYGQLAVMDAKTLEEKRHLPAGWCKDDSGSDKGGDADKGGGDAAPEPSGDE